MAESQVAPYGSWKSPITSTLIVKGSIGVGQVALDGEDVYWVEMRPSEGGRSVIVRRTPDGQTTDVNPMPFNARTRVHEYGGGDYLVADGTVYFSNFDDQRLYKQSTDSQPEPLTPAVLMRYAEPIIDRRRGCLISVREDHTRGGEAVNTLASISLEDGSQQRVLAMGNDFYSSPRLSPDGSRLAWLTWNHPNMPWDGTELWVGEFASDGSLVNERLVAGGVDESIFQPEWSPDGVLYFVSDRSGWWNLYREKEQGSVESLSEMQAEFGGPQWVFGLSMYAFESASRIICTYIEKGNSRLAHLETDTGKFEKIELPYTDITYLHASSGRAAFRGGSLTDAASIIQLDLGTGKVEILRRSNDLKIDTGYFSIPQAIEFPTEDGKTAHAFYYPPRNRDYVAAEGELPPLLVKSHGGPTSAATTTLALGIQYWTSRGIGVLDVNYGGSTGYGREYRRRLNDRWGIVDVDDCSNGARYLVERGLADGLRLMITGGSAGGYTTLCALTFRDRFKAGASHYGVSDCEALAKETHKFESRYLDRLIGPYPERADLYRERSPVHHVDRLSCPVIFFQGLEDKVVLPNQAEMMVEALRAKGLPVAYVPFEGEQHGFRRAENIKRALDGEIYFYSRIFGFELADNVEPVPIENL
ncbi:MAG TPA: S9 family peptidase [Pyrinomonadaceae bacterium]|jgi:dipeptidyl aminopeptidase/acylaminoacyl peptidase|nr:S9 family peptidase [Pyrinomonadaceae bacterium]